MLKKFLIGTVVALALLVGVTASAADFGSTTLRVGSKGEAVKAVQTLVGATPIDGIFGPMTKAKVMAWQASNGLTADGLFGSMSKAKAVNGGSVVGGTTLPAGCSAGAMFSSTTGASCTAVVTTLPAGCSAGAMFSSTTGASCTGTTTVVTGPLQGGAGSISADSTSTDVNNYMVEGQSDVKGLGFKVTADGSDVSISNIKVTLDHNTSTGTSSSYLDRYVANVGIWMNGVKVGSANASEFSKDSTGKYSKSIALNNAIVRMGTSSKATFYVTITGISNIDSNDMVTGSKWVVTASDFRYQDATGVIMSYTNTTTPLTNSLDVKDINGTGDVKLVITKDSTSPDTGNVKISDTASTSDIKLLAFNAKDTGATMDFDSMNIDITTTTSPLAMIGELTLKANGTSIATWSPAVTDTTTGTSTLTVPFSLDSTYTLPADSTTLFTVEAKINSIKNFTAGSLSASYNNTTPIEVTSTRSTIAEEGAAAGSAQTFFANGIVASVFTYGSPVVSTNTSGTTTSATYAISFKVTASGNSYYVLKTGLASKTTTGTDHFAPLSASGATDSSTYWLVADGSTATFTTTGALDVATPGNGTFAKIGLDTLKYNIATTGTDSTYYFNPATSFETSSTLITR